MNEASRWKYSRYSFAFLAARVIHRDEMLRRLAPPIQPGCHVPCVNSWRRLSFEPTECLQAILVAGLIGGGCKCSKQACWRRRPFGRLAVERISRRAATSEELQFD